VSSPSSSFISSSVGSSISISFCSLITFLSSISPSSVVVSPSSCDPVSVSVPDSSVSGSSNTSPISPSSSSTLFSYSLPLTGSSHPHSGRSPLHILSTASSSSTSVSFPSTGFVTGGFSVGGNIIMRSPFSFVSRFIVSFIIVVGCWPITKIPSYAAFAFPFLCYYI
jgi:hypothetical protein